MIPNAKIEMIKTRKKDQEAVGEDFAEEVKLFCCDAPLTRDGKMSLKLGQVQTDKVAGSHIRSRLVLRLPCLAVALVSLAMHEPGASTCQHLPANNARLQTSRTKEGATPVSFRPVRSQQFGARVHRAEPRTQRGPLVLARSSYGRPRSMVSVDAALGNPLLRALTGTEGRIKAADGET